MSKILELVKPLNLRFKERETGFPEGDEIKLKAVMSAVSHGTEMSLYNGTSPFADRMFNTDLRLFEDNPHPYPMSLGYEWVGCVTEAGPKARMFSAGDRVHLPLPHADWHICSESQMIQWGSGKPLPDSVSTESACFLSLISIALQAVHDARINLGDHIVIFGMGVLGLITVKLARLAGAGKITAVEPLIERRTLACKWGADDAYSPVESDVGLELKSCSEGADTAIEFSGNDRALHQAIRAVRKGGRVVAAGFYQGGSSHVMLGEEWLHNRITMAASSRGWGNVHRDYPRWNRARLAAQAIDLLEKESLKPETLISEFHDFHRAPEVFSLIKSDPDKYMKMVFKYGE